MVGGPKECGCLCLSGRQLFFKPVASLWGEETWGGVVGLPILFGDEKHFRVPGEKEGGTYLCSELVSCT